MTSEKGKKSSSDLKTFFKKLHLDTFFDHKAVKIAIPLLFIFIIMWFTFLTRIGPVSLDGLDERIEANTYNQILSIIQQDVDAQYPDLNAIYKQELVQDKFNEAVDQGYYDVQGQRLDIQAIIDTNVAQVKDAFKAENGQTYLTAIDPYHFERLSYLYHLNGFVGDELRVVDGEEVPFLSYKLAPNGIKGTENPSFHVWLESLLYSMNGIDENSTHGERTKAIFLLPVLLVLLAVLPCYFIIRAFSNDLYALFGTLLMVSVGTFVSRTVAGFVDTDAYNVLFPLLIVCSLVYALVCSGKQRWLSYGLIVLAGFLQGVFLWAWEAGWFIFVFTFLALVGYEVMRLVSDFLKDSKHFMKNLAKHAFSAISIVLYFVSSWIFVFLFTGKELVSEILGGALSSVSGIAGISGASIWPNVFSSVAELNPASFGTIVGVVGGEVTFILAMTGLLFLALDYKVSKDKFSLYNKILLAVGIVFFIMVVQGNIITFLTANLPLVFLAVLFAPVGIALLFALWNQSIDLKVFLALLLSFWMAGTIYMSLNGVRFILLLGPAFAIAFALGLFYIGRAVNNYMTEQMKFKHNISKKVTGFVLVFIVFAVLFNPLATSALNISKNTLPNFDDAWYNSMIKIKDNSQEDAIITSWWDFGHFFSSVSERGVTFDGGSQTTPQSHWVGKLLFESDEKVALDILRMITCGGNNAFDTIFEITEDPTNGVFTNQLIYDTFGKTKDEKIQILRDYEYYTFSDEQITQIMEELHCDNPKENFVITSGDMVGKAPVWSHWGTWDFTKKYVHDNYNSMTVSEISSLLDTNESLIEQYVSELQQIDLRSQTENIKRSDLVNPWFSPYYGYVPVGGSTVHSCQLQEGMFVCMNGQLLINQTSGQIASNAIAVEQLKNLVYPTPDNRIVTVEQNGGAGAVDVVLIPFASSPQVVLAQSPLGESLFTKLFYLRGSGLEHFESFDAVDSATGVQLLVWKVNFELNETSSQ